MSATVTAEGTVTAGGEPVVGATVQLWAPTAFTTTPPTYNSAAPGGSPAYGPDTTDADGNWSIASVAAGLYWVSIDDGAVVTWTLTSFEPAATVVTSTPGGGGGTTWGGGTLPLDFGSTNHSDVVYLFDDLGGNVYGFGIDDSTMVLFAPNGGGHWDFRRATSTPSGWNGTPVARVDDSGNLLANGGTSSNPGHAFLAEPALGFYRQASGVIGATGHLRPAVTATSDLGSTSLRWAALWAGAATLASAAISGALSAGATTLGATSATSLTLGTPLADAYVADALTISGGTVDNTPIGNTTRALGKFTTVDASTTVVAGTTVTAGTGVTATTGNIAASSGNVTASALMSAGTTITAGTGLIATTGGVTASAGNIVATLGNITASAGNIAATLGSVSAGTSVAAGTFATTGTYLDVGSVLGVGVTHDATKARAYVLDASVAQLRLAQAAAKWADFSVDSSGVLVLDTSGNIFKQAAGESFRSFSYTSGVNGFSVNSDGDIEANNIRARGELRGSTFVVNEIQAFGGTTFVSKSAGTFNAAFTSASVAGSTASSDTASVQIKNTLTNAAPVVVGDVMWVKTVDPTSGIFSCYFEVRAASTGASVTTCTLRLRSGSTSVSIPAGASFVVLGTTSGGAWISQSADGAIGAVPNLTMATHSGSPWSTTVGRLRLGNLNGTFDYASDVYGLVVGADIGVSAASFKGFAVDASSGLRLYNAAIAQYLAGVQTVNVLANGTFLLGTNVSTAAGISLLVTPPGGGNGLETLAAGAVLIGPNTGPNALWDGTNFNIRSALTTRVQMDSGGALRLKNSAGTDTIVLDGSGASYFAGPMTIGTSGGFYQSTSGTFASPAGNGWRAWNNSGVGTQEWYASGVKINTLDNLGLTLRVNSGLGGSYLQWTDGTRVVGKVEMSAGGGFNPSIALTARQVDATYPEAYAGLIAETRDATYRYNVGAFVNSYGGAGTAYDAFDVGNAVRIALVGGGVTNRPTYVRLSVGTGALMVGSSFSSSSTPTSGYIADFSGSVVVQTALKVGATSAVTSGYVVDVNGHVRVTNGTTGRLSFAAAGAAAPSFTTPSAGEKFTLYSVIDGSTANYAIGVESGSLWLGLPLTGSSLKVYGGTTLAWTLNGNGNGTCVGTLTQSSRRATKDGFAAFPDARALSMLMALPPLETYHKRTDETRERHLSSMADDFHPITGLGNSEGIAPSDAAFLAIGAVRELARRVALLENR